MTEIWIMDVTDTKDPTRFHGHAYEISEPDRERQRLVFWESHDGSVRGSHVVHVGTASAMRRLKGDFEDRYGGYVTLCNARLLMGEEP